MHYASGACLWLEVLVNIYACLGMQKTRQSIAFLNKKAS